MDRYAGTKILQYKDVNDDNRYYKGTKYPTIPLSETDIYVITTQGDRLDVLPL